MGGKGEGGIKNLKKWAMSFMDGPLCTLQLPIFIYERTEKYTQEATAHQVPHYLRPNNNIKVYRPTTSYYTLTTWKITLTVQVLKNPSSSKYIITIDKTFIFLKKIR